MSLRQFYDWQTAGGGDDDSRLVATLERGEIAWCMIGGLAVNHWARAVPANQDPQHRASKRQNTCWTSCAWSRRIRNSANYCRQTWPKN